MKMREELEMFKQRCAELEAHLATKLDQHNVDMDALITEHNVETNQMQSDFNKKLESANSSTKYYSGKQDELTGQINNLQDILDVIPNVLPRKKVDENGYSSGDNPCHVRLASVLAQKFM